MSKKRKKYRASQHREEKKLKRDTARVQHPLENSVLSYLHSSKGPVAVEKIVRSKSRKGEAYGDIDAVIKNLVSKKLVRKTGKGQLVLDKTVPLYEGLLERSPRGSGFITDTVPYLKAVPLPRDPYIAPAAIGHANHGDRVLIRVTRLRNDGRPEAAVVKILSHGRDTIPGFYYTTQNAGVVYPEDPRFPFHVMVAPQTPEPRQGDAVIVRLQRDTSSSHKVFGEITEILGNPDSIDVQMRLVIEKFSLPHAFTERALQEAEKLSDDFSPSADRLDLREIEHITIDGETARDFDDAISVKKTRTGFQLYVSIADVSHFVQPGSNLDREAYARGTSIYFPGRVIPMLPEKLSNDICSLLPGEDRFAITALLTFDRGGKLLKKKFTRSIIRSRHRFTYSTVGLILIDKDPDTRRQHKPFLTQLKWAYELAVALHDKRKKRGSIFFTIPESKITLTETGDILEIAASKRTFAHQIIEEFMLAANEAVAEFFTLNHRDGLYRVHEPPDNDKVAEFITFAKTLGLHLTKMDGSPGWFAGIVEQCRGTKTEYIVNNLLLRTMQQAHYSPKNIGHFGLASSHYTHFTSPIRRYPDLSVHRELVLAIRNSMTAPGDKKMQPTLRQAGTFLSGRERTAIKAERDINERLKARYMGKRLGESFEAIISGVNDFAIFVELKKIFISGSIGLKHLSGDYYLYDEKHHRLIGELTGTIFQIGDSIEVTPVDVDYGNNRISFIPTQGRES